MVSVRIPTAILSDFYTRAATISSKQLFNCTHKAEWTPFQTHYFSENLIALGIESGTLGSAARNSDHLTTEAVNQNSVQEEIMRTEFW
jgi:hypothetical protein